MPNENAIIYGRETRSDSSRQKRAIPLGLLFSGVSTIGGLIMKGVNTWSNYKKSKAMTKAVEKLYEAQEIDHHRLTRLEGQKGENNKNHFSTYRLPTVTFRHKIELYGTTHDRLLSKN